MKGELEKFQPREGGWGLEMVCFEPQVNRRYERVGNYIAWVKTYFVKSRGFKKYSFMVI